MLDWSKADFNVMEMGMVEGRFGLFGTLGGSV